MKAIWIQDGAKGKGAREVTAGMLIALFETQDTDTVLVGNDPIYRITIEKTTLAELAIEAGSMKPLDLEG